MKLIVFIYFFLLFSCHFDRVLGKLCGKWYKGLLFGCCASDKNGCAYVPKIGYNCWCDVCVNPDEKTGKCPEGSELASARPSTVVRTIPRVYTETTTTSDGNGGETQNQLADHGSEDGDGANSGVGAVRGSMVVAFVAVCMAMVVGGAIDGGGIGVGAFTALLMVMEQLGKNGEARMRNHITNARMGRN